MQINIMTEGVIHKELDIIQDVIKRMSANSFQVKTWMMGIVTAILAFKNEEIFSAGKTAHHEGIWISAALILPVIMFWYLDAFFLKNEKLYREIYKWVIANRRLTDKYLYDLNTFQRENYNHQTRPIVDLTAKVDSVQKTMISETLRWFYAIPLTIILALIVYNLTL